MRISDWSSDVCSSDLPCPAKWRATARPMPDPPPVMKIAFRAIRSLLTLMSMRHDAKSAPRSSGNRGLAKSGGAREESADDPRPSLDPPVAADAVRGPRHPGARRSGRELVQPRLDRKSGVSGKSVAVRVDLVGRRILQK